MTACLKPGSGGGFGTDTGGSTNSSSSVDVPMLACGSTPHDGTETRVMFQATSVAHGQICKSETQSRTCTNGVFGKYSGSFTYPACVVLPANPVSCGSTPHGGTETRMMYQSSTVAFGQVCKSETQSRTCTNGAFGNYSGTYAYSSCSVLPAVPLACGSTAHGASESRVMYEAFTVPHGQVCKSETQSRLCTNGVLGNYSGNYTYSACSVLPPVDVPASAFVVGDRIQVTKNTNVRATGTLTGTLLGVQNAEATGTLVAGPTVKDQNNIIWWQVNYDNGADGWSGEDNFTKIAVGSCGSILNGGSISRLRYLTNIVPEGQVCQIENQIATCTNGVLSDYSGTYTHTSCSGPSALGSPSQSAINAAIATQLISYRRSFSGGAYTNGARFGGASIVLAVASHTGNTTADKRLLEQIRHTLTSGNEICANGGYPAQHETQVTGMFAIAKKTPRIWGQLTDKEKLKVDLMMKASLISSAFTTSDNNPYILAKTQQYTLDGDSNLSRGWNPNYREGMVGGVLTGMVYFGGPAEANQILDTYNHAKFTAELLANGLPNTYEIFNWKAAKPTSTAPAGKDIEAAVKNYKIYKFGLTNYTDIYLSLLNDTYGQKVTAGLNNGAGINGSGKIASGASGLPNLGVVGMLKEFNSSDAGGPRSSMLYSYDGFRPHQNNHLVLLIGGYLPKGNPALSAIAERLRIGNTDLWYKIEKGYLNYSKGKGSTSPDTNFAAHVGFPYMRSLWEDVLRPYYFPTPVK